VESRTRKDEGREEKRLEETIEARLLKRDYRRETIEERLDDKQPLTQKLSNNNDTDTRYNKRWKLNIAKQKVTLTIRRSNSQTRKQK
jgi:hypothetical protein